MHILTDPLSLHDALPISPRWSSERRDGANEPPPRPIDPRELQLRVRGHHPRPPHAAEHADSLPRRGGRPGGCEEVNRSEEHTSELQSLTNFVCRLILGTQ